MSDRLRTLGIARLALLTISCPIIIASLGGCATNSLSRQINEYAASEEPSNASLGGISVSNGDRQIVRSVVRTPGPRARKVTSTDIIFRQPVSWGVLVVARPAKESGEVSPLSKFTDQQAKAIADIFSRSLGDQLYDAKSLHDREIELLIFSSTERLGYYYAVKQNLDKKPIQIAVPARSLSQSTDPTWWAAAAGSAAHELTHLNHLMLNSNTGSSDCAMINAEVAASIAEFCAELSFRGQLAASAGEKEVPVFWEAAEYPEVFPRLDEGSFKPLLEAQSRYTDPTDIGKLVASAVLYVNTAGRPIPVDADGSIPELRKVCSVARNHIPDFLSGELSAPQ